MLHGFKRRKKTPLPLPEGVTAEDVAVERSICTGEALIGFRDPKSGKLLCAQAFRTNADRKDFYARYGLTPPDARNG